MNCGGAGPRADQWYALATPTARRPPSATHRHLRAFRRRAGGGAPRAVPSAEQWATPSANQAPVAGLSRSKTRSRRVGTAEDCLHLLAQLIEPLAVMGGIRALFGITDSADLHYHLHPFVGQVATRLVHLLGEGPQIRAGHRGRCDELVAQLGLGRPELRPQRPELRPVIADDLPDLRLLGLVQPCAVDEQRQRVKTVGAHSPAPSPLGEGTRCPEAHRHHHDNRDGSSRAHSRPPPVAIGSSSMLSGEVISAITVAGSETRTDAAVTPGDESSSVTSSSSDNASAVVSGCGSTSALDSRHSTASPPARRPIPATIAAAAIQRRRPRRPARRIGLAWSRSERVISFKSSSSWR